MLLSAELAITAVLLLCVLPSEGGCRTVTLISDIHYDPLYGTAKAYVCTSSSSSAWGVPGCDSSAQLATRALEDVSAHNTSLVLYAGDWQRHRYISSGLEPAQVFSEMSAWFGAVSIDESLGKKAFATSLGNNDFVPDYYFDWKNETSNKELAQRVEAVQAAGLLTVAEAGTIARCGYYTHELAELHVIVLHTLLWSRRLVPVLSRDVTDPCDQFSFLQMELAKVRAAGKRAIIMGHIPPGLNVYKVVDKGFGTAKTDMYWKKRFERRYDSIIHEYKDLVAVQLFGHTHRFTLLAMQRNGALGMILPAISPIFNNYPSYLLSNFTDDWMLEDVRIRYLTDSAAFRSGLSAKSAMGIATGLQSFTAVRTAVMQLATDDAMWERYLTMFCGGDTQMDVFPGSRCDQRCRFVVVCSMLENQYDDIKRCVAEYISKWPAKPQNDDDDGDDEDDDTHRVIAVTIILLCFVVAAMDAVLLLMVNRRQMTFTMSNLTSSTWWKSLFVKPEGSAAALSTG